MTKPIRKEASLADIRIRLRRDLRQAVIERLQQTYQSRQVRLVRRIHALLFVIEGKAIDEVATMLNLGHRRCEIT